LESLTPTERQVVDLVTHGTTNPQIAERMFISGSTVKVHFVHIFRKLDLSSRSQLTALAVRRAEYRMRA
jgi:DNA-binding NarL/FixJ family response regulator